MTFSNDELSQLSASDFFQNYSNLILAIWGNPDLGQQIESDPSLIQQFGFQKVPRAIRLESPLTDVSPSREGYEQQKRIYEEAGEEDTVVLYIPLQPRIEAGSVVPQNTTACCCCCPCCSCSRGNEPPL